MSPSISTKGMLNLIVVYLVWGSTYLFIRLTVHEGSGFPPFAMAASRTLCASAILFILAKGLGQWSRPSGSELRVLIVSGLLLWLGGNGLVAYAEHHANSGYAALVIGTTPMWPVIMESILERRPPSPLLVLSLIIGFSGLAVLVTPVLKQGLRADALSTAALLLAAMAWSGGSLLLQRRPPKATPILTSAYQQFFGSLGLIAITLLSGEPWPHPTAAGLARLDLPGHCRLVDQLHGLCHRRAHPAPFRGHDLCLHQPGDRRYIGLAGAGRAHHLGDRFGDGPHPDRCLRDFLETVRTWREMT